LQLLAHPENSQWFSIIFCYYFWGQLFCWKETSILSNNAFAFYKFALPLPLLRRPWKH